MKVQQGARQAGQLKTVLNNAELQAYGYRTQQTAFTEQAGLETMEAQQAPVAAELATAGGEYAAAGAEEGAVGSLLSSASGIGFKIGGLTSPSTSSGGGTGLSGSSWSLNIPGYNSLSSLFS